VDDDGAGGDETFNGIYIVPSAGTNAITRGLVLANTLDDGIVATIGAAGQYAVVDAASAVQTQTAGVFDISHSSATNATSVINISHTVGDLGASEASTAILIDTVDNTSSNSAFVRGVAITSSDIAGEAGTINQAIYTSGLDCALQADNGYVRIGTGSTPGVTPSDDDLFVEGVAEVDTYVRAPYFVIDSNSTALSRIHVDTMEITNSEIKNLNGTPKVLIAAPGANYFIEVVSVCFVFDYGSEALTESTDNLVVEYTTSGTDITGAIEAGGLIDATADTIAVYYPAAQAGVASANMANRSVQLTNTGDGEYGGNASNDTTISVKIAYRVHADGLDVP